MAASLGASALPLVTVMAIAGLGGFAVFHSTTRHRGSGRL